ncbi:MAG: DHH family phosphoesterase [Oscillospiraceae bacterium]|nr:DHH family phosphoesterase [Oscillospiraceae bacterium]
MNKKLTRMLEPGMWVYFLAMAVVTGVCFWRRSFLAGAVGAALLVVLFIYNNIMRLRRKKALLSYLQHTAATMAPEAKGLSPFPTATIRMTDGEIVWANEEFCEAVGVRGNREYWKIDSIIPHFNTRWLTEGSTECPQEARIGQHRYRIYGSLVRSEDAEASLLLANLYLSDTTELFNTKDEYYRSRPIVSMILVDNYDELTNNLPDGTISSLDAQINEKIGAWCRDLGGLLRKYERNRYLLIFEAKDLPKLQEDKFSILDEIRTVLNPSGVAATVSLGIGKDGESYQENFSFAALSIEMALSRGGDQVVIKDRYNFNFFGGRTKETERRTKVKARVIAGSLTQLINESGLILIMGHKMADLDALGAAMGLVTICRKCQKTVRVVMDRENTAAASLLQALDEHGDYGDLFISGEDALLAADSKTLLIVVDTNRPTQVENQALLESINRVVVIDHHRRAADYIERVVLNFHEPFASSASELVAELLQYAVDTKDIRPIEARALLSGIVLDTKNFSVRTGARTFEAAAFLRRAGADTVDVKKLLQSDLTDTVARYQIIQKARLYRNEIAVAPLDYTVPRPMAAAAADELLNVKGVTASFVLFPDDDRIIVSARSIGETNVQVILEALGGGGNAAIAGAQIAGKDMRTVLEELVASIDKFFER